MSGPLVRIAFFYTDPLGRRCGTELDVNLTELFNVFQMVGTAKSEDQLNYFVAYISMMATNNHLQDEDARRVKAAIEWIRVGIHRHDGVYPASWKPGTDDALINFCYFLLKGKVINRQEAADFAATQIGGDADRDARREAWRKRVDRWAASPEVRLPPVGVPRTKRKH